jgi:DNA-binding CsgD family transcriptional regulator
MADLDRSKGLFEEAFDRVPRNVVVLDRDRRVTFANKRARVLLDKGDGLKVGRDGRLTASSSFDHAQLRVAVDAIFAERSIENVHAALGGVLTISRPSGKRPLEILLSPFEDDRSLALAAGRSAIAFISDPEDTWETVDAVLMRLYGLTVAEARLACLLASGISLKEAAEILDVTGNTVRSQIKSIFSKTGTNRQGELIKLILGGSASLKGPSAKPES